MRNRRNHSNESGVVRTFGYVALMAIIVVKVFASVLNTIMNTIEDINESRRRSRA
jgi:hypothetical protein